MDPPPAVGNVRSHEQQRESAKLRAPGPRRERHHRRV